MNKQELLDAIKRLDAKYEYKAIVTNSSIRYEKEEFIKKSHVIDLINELNEVKLRDVITLRFIQIFKNLRGG